VKIILLIVVTVFMIIGVYLNKRTVIPSELKLYKRMTYLLSLALLLTQLSHLENREKPGKNIGFHEI